MAELKPEPGAENGITIRRAGPDDLDDLVRLRLAMLNEIQPQEVHTHVPKLAAANRRYFAQHIPEGGYVGWLAEAEGQIISTAGLVLFERPPGTYNLAGMEAYVLNVYTLPAWRGRGIAGQLIDTIIAYARTTSIRRLWLHATPAGAGIYHKAGFADRIEMELRW
jgi:GNAT superfamily N-acetyltransferase